MHFRATCKEGAAVVTTCLWNTEASYAVRLHVFIKPNHNALNLSDLTQNNSRPQTAGGTSEGNCCSLLWWSPPVVSSSSSIDFRGLQRWRSNRCCIAGVALGSVCGNDCNYSEFNITVVGGSVCLLVLKFFTGSNPPLRQLKDSSVSIYWKLMIL